MIERANPSIETSELDTDPDKRKRAKRNKKLLTEDTVQRLKLPTKEEKQDVVWDQKQAGLSVLLSQSTRTYRATFRLDGKQVTAKIGRIDNEADKGDHRHIGDKEEAYAFSDPETLQVDFWTDVSERRSP